MSSTKIKTGENTEWDAETYQNHIEDCIEYIDKRFYELMDTKTLGDQAIAISYLREAVQSLTTWHRRFNYETLRIDSKEEPLFDTQEQT